MVTSSAEFGKRSIAIGWDSDDARKALGDEAWDAKSPSEQMAWLSKRVDLEVLVYLRKEDVITDGYMQDRITMVMSR